MGFGRKKKKSRVVWILLPIIVIILGGLSFGGYYLYQQELSKIENKYNQVIKELNSERESLSKLALVPKYNLEAGETIYADNLEIKEILTNLEEDEYITPDDYGSVLTVDIDKGIPVMENMITHQIVDNEIREQEMGMLMLPSNIERYDYVDVRIGFSNGEDYIVLSKKKVQNVDAETNTVWVWVDESEILTLSSAIVDAYIHEGTKLYALTYVSPEIQEPAIVNYPVNEDVEALVLNDPNIIDEANLALNASARAELEKKLNEISDEIIQNVASGIDDEESKREQVIIFDEGVEEAHIEEEIKVKPALEEQDSLSNRVTITGEESEDSEEEESDGFY